MSRADRGDVGVPADASAGCSSRTHADVVCVSALVVELQDAGLTVWWDRRRIARSMASPRGWKRHRRGAGGGDVSVQTYPSRPACQWEALQVLRRLPQGDVARTVASGGGDAGGRAVGLADLVRPGCPTPLRPRPVERMWARPVPKGLALHGADAAACRNPWCGRSVPAWGAADRPQRVEEHRRAHRQAPVIWLPDQQARSKTFTGRFAELLESALPAGIGQDRPGFGTGGGAPTGVSGGHRRVGKNMLVQEYVNQFSGYWPVVIKSTRPRTASGTASPAIQRAQWLDALAGEVWRLRVLWSEKSGGPAVSAGWDGDTSVGVNHPDQDQVWVARQRLERERARLAAALARGWVGALVGRRHPRQVRRRPFPAAVCR